MVERWFREITGDHRQGHTPGVIASVPDLIAAIEAYLAANNAEPKPFVWAATAEQILAKVRRGRIALQEVAS